MIRFFEDEVKSRIAEVAAEVWDVVQRRQESGLRRLRNFLEQFRAPGESRSVIEICLLRITYDV